MPGHESKTLSDDFIERVTKAFRPEFIENVNDPTLLVDYLQCLETIDEEMVKAQQTQYGATHAASVLFDHLIRRPEWIEDLNRALREPGIGLGFLADKLENFELTISGRWDICMFTDEYGKACFNGNCSDTDLVDGKDPDSLFNKLVGGNSGNDETTKSAPVQTDHEQSPMEITTPETTVNLGIDDVKEALRMKREEIRLKFMEKVYSFVQLPEDVPVAIHYMEKINVQLDKIDRGSVIFSIYVGSFDALQTFEQLWRYGGLKKMLDKEMLNQDMLKELKAVAVKAGHPVDNIQSQLEVFDTDIERCRSALIKSNFGFRPTNFADSYLLQDKSRGKERKLREITFYATERLPDELKCMLEDPFVSDRVARFFESDSLRQKFKNEEDGESTTSSMSVAWHFTEWLNEELVTYLTDLDPDTKQHLLTLAVYLIHAIGHDGTLAIPHEALSENFKIEEVKTTFPTVSVDSGCWLDMIKIPSEVIVDSGTLLTACKELMAKRVMCRSKNHLICLSELIKDAFVAKVVLCSNCKGSIKVIAGSFEYMQTLIGLFEGKVRSYFSDQDMGEVATCSFKTDELRKIGIHGTHTLTIGSESSFYNTDLFSCRPGTVELTKEISDAGETIKRRLKANLQTKNICFDISEVTDEESFSVETGLHWLNALTRKQSGQESFLGMGSVWRQSDFVRSISVSNSFVNGKTLNSIGMYLNVTPSLSSMSLRHCQLKSNLLRNVLQSGHFRNIRHVNISDNDIFQGSSQPIGLMYITSLERLEIQSCHLGDDGMKLLAVDLHHMQKLRELNIANNRITSRGLLALTKALSKNRRISGLRIHKNYIGKEGSLILASWLESMILLEVLNISECGIGDKGSTMIASALVSRSLRKLSMRKNDITPKGSRDFFKTFHRPPYLEHLDFSENALFAVSDRRTIAVAADLFPTASKEPFLKFLQDPTPMSHLSLWNTCLGEKRLFQGWQNYKCFADMTYLCLQENNLSDDFARDISECIIQSNCSNLQHFNLRQNHIGNMGAIDIAKALSKQMYLKEVLLDRNEIGDEGAKQIMGSCISLPSVERIDLSCNNISRQMMDSIVNDLYQIHSTHTYDGVPISEDTQRVIPDIVKIPSSFDENSFIVKKDYDKYLITM
ncbi:uncharacterized protein LOC123532121 [Mercenaria mercenaria]|uniref:uncharacterized protein LOC123532121 n=1 Tax=Mercenaria mercenaria TaxID=6596 RepID=UPI00234F66C8|nr:uncharacterized protein LOC123532121 [Mercenaria mercenaria]XP_053374560.1 uncharacterized protein LOC123532121 [Mercenaria mercenaria]